MNYSHDNWSAILAHIGKPEELDTSARNAGALTRRREIRDAATLLRLGLAYGPGGMSLREVTAWAQLHDVATLSDVALLKRLRNAADWFGILAAQTLAVRAAVTGCTSGKRLRLVDGTKEPELAKAWIFANLLAAFLIDDIIQPSLDFPPRSAGSEKKN
ncbi:hypothetical protein FQP75_06595 [Escherichia coli]|nr:hypothetical protein [Escherichia coli]MBL3996496.1 hypothetical protein [Escherichia coli]